MNTSQNDQAIDRAATTIEPRPDMGERPRDFPAPLGAATSGRLEIVPGASRVTIGADAALPGLCRARFEGEPPSVSARDGVVTIRYPPIRSSIGSRTCC